MYCKYGPLLSLFKTLYFCHVRRAILCITALLFMVLGFCCGTSISISTESVIILLW